MKTKARPLTHDKELSSSTKNNASKTGLNHRRACSHGFRLRGHASPGPATSRRSSRITIDSDLLFASLSLLVLLLFAAADTAFKS